MADKIFGADLKATPLKLVQTPAVVPANAAKAKPVYFQGGVAAAVGNATTANAGLVKKAAAQADSTATDVAGLKTDLNALLAKLRTAGII